MFKVGDIVQYVADLQSEDSYTQEDVGDGFGVIQYIWPEAKNPEYAAPFPYYVEFSNNNIEYDVSRPVATLIPCAAEELELVVLQ